MSYLSYLSYPPYPPYPPYSPYNLRPCCDCGDVKRRQVRSTESAGASEVQWTEQEYRVAPSRRSSRQAWLTILSLLLVLSSCHTQQHTVTTSDNHTQQSALTNSTQVVNVFDSLLHQLDFTADSIVITYGDVGAYGVPAKPALWGVSLARGITSNASEANQQHEVTNTESPTRRHQHAVSAPVLRLTAHRPHLTTQSTQTTQTTQTTSEAQTTETMQTTATTQTTDKTQTVIASPMNGTAVVITISIAFLLILAALAFFFLKKYKII